MKGFKISIVSTECPLLIVDRSLNPGSSQDGNSKKLFRNWSDVPGERWGFDFNHQLLSRFAVAERSERKKSGRAIARVRFIRKFSVTISSVDSQEVFHGDGKLRLTKRRAPSFYDDRTVASSERGEVDISLDKLISRFTAVIKSCQFSQFMDLVSVITRARLVELIPKADKRNEIKTTKVTKTSKGDRDNISSVVHSVDVPAQKSMPRSITREKRTGVRCAACLSKARLKCSTTRFDIFRIL